MFYSTAITLAVLYGLTWLFSVPVAIGITAVVAICFAYMRGEFM